MRTDNNGKNQLLREEDEEEDLRHPPFQIPVRSRIEDAGYPRSRPSEDEDHASDGTHPPHSRTPRDSRGNRGTDLRFVSSSSCRNSDGKGDVSKEKNEAERKKFETSSSVPSVRRNERSDSTHKKEDRPPSPRNSFRSEGVNQSFTNSIGDFDMRRQERCALPNQGAFDRLDQHSEVSTTGLPASDANERTGGRRSWLGGRPERSSLMSEDDDDDHHPSSLTAGRASRYSLPSASGEASHRRTSSPRLERSRRRKRNRRSNSGRSLYSEDSDELVIVQPGSTRIVPLPPPRRPAIEIDKNTSNLTDHQRSVLADDGIVFENGNLVFNEMLQLERRQRKQRLTMAVVVALLLLGVVGGAVGYHTSKRKMKKRTSATPPFVGSSIRETPSWSPSSEPSISPSNAPSNIPTSTRQACILETFRQADYMTSDMIRRMTTVSSPQNRALEWLATHDPAQISCTNENDMRYRYLFATVYFATGGPTSWGDSLNFLTEKPVCQWYRRIEPDKQSSGASMESQVRWKGVLCNSNVENSLPDVSLILDDQNLTGTIPEELILLDQFKSLSFAHNHLTGTLPIFIPTLPRLFEFMVNDNYIGGPIPDSYGDSVSSQLTVMDLEHNALTGTLPSSLGKVKSLSWLSLSYNALNGTIPETIRNLSTMERLFLSYNRLSGNLAHAIEKLPRSLWYLWLERNDFSGTIPNLLGEEFDRLESFDLRSNTKLQHGTIPSSMKQLSKLWELSLSGCGLTGTLPFDDSNSFPHLETLRLHDNVLQGTVPPALLGLRRLDVLLLSNNALSGSLVLPQSVDASSWVVLRELSLAQNNLSGTIPPTLGTTFPQIEALGLSENNLTGTIPTELAQLPQLRILSLRNNSFTGTLPEQLGSLSHIHDLLVNGNQLTGTVPRSFRNLTTLGHLDMANNSLTGDVSFLCEIQELSADCDFGDTVNGTTRRGEVTCECCSICCNDAGYCHGANRRFL